MVEVIEPVGRESEAHPAVSAVLSLDFESYNMLSFKIINACSYFGQEFPAAFQQHDREKERAARSKGVNILRHSQA